MRDYREKKVKGLISDGSHINRVPVDVRMTSDSIGQTLSFTADNSIMIAIPLEQVKDIIRVVEKGEKK